MDVEAALKKVFAKLDELSERLDGLDTNGKLEEIQKQMSTVAANSQVVVNTVESHGDVIAKLEKRLTRLDLRCPLMKPDTDEFESVSERLKLKDE